MNYARYSFSCVFDEAAFLPKFKGSLLRGMLGKHLRNVSCALRNGECASCLLAPRCVYNQAFESLLPGDSGRTPPHPYLLEHQSNDKSEYAAGEAFSFHLTLFGEMIVNLPYFIYAIEKMGETGIGASREHGLARFRLQDVSDNRKSVYNSEQHVLDISSTTRQLEVTEPATQPASCITLRLLTPLRVKNNNKFTTELPFHVLVRAMLRRISSIYARYAEGEPDLDYPGLTKRASDVVIREKKLRWKDWTRYSSRQKQTMQFGGLVGSITYAGELAEYLPLLEACKILHVGKQSVFGLGQIDYSPIETP